MNHSPFSTSSLSLLTAWRLQKDLDGVVFDCDSTLSNIEGINVLADQNHVSAAVRDLTEKAMSELGMQPDLYRQRLELVKPRISQVVATAEAYYDALTPDTDWVIRILINLGKRVCVASAGLTQAVVPFAARLGIPVEDVFAVEGHFDADGNYVGFDEESPLTRVDGKREVIEMLQATHPSLAHVGDGMNDVAVAGFVERFIGYGGTTYRENIARLSDFYITSESMAAALPLLLTVEEANSLTVRERSFYQKGLTLLEEGYVRVINA